MYCDDRKVLSYPKMRDFVRLELARVISEMYPDADVVAGVAINAIAHGVLVAEQLSLPFVYVHPTPKNHGLENQIEGDLRPRQSVVVVENQVNTGENIIKVVEVLRNNGCKVLGVVTIFDYAFPATRKKLEEMDITLTPLTDFETVLRHAAAMEMIDEDQRKSIAKWQSNPAKWKK
jgi:orotate phosphoribosyltransferase